MRKDPIKRRGDAERRAERISANGPAERYTKAEIGERDNWICGVCKDPERLVDPSQHHQHLLAAVVDHVLPIARGGPDTIDNVQIAHRKCNATKHSGAHIAPSYAVAVLTQAIDETPIPLEAWFAQTPLSDDPRNRMRGIAAAQDSINRGKVAGPMPPELTEEFAALRRSLFSERTGELLTPRTQAPTSNHAAASLAP